MAVLIVGISLIFIGAGLTAGLNHDSRMQLELNKAVGHDLGGSVGNLLDRELVAGFVLAVKKIYDSAPEELRDAPGNPDEEYLYSVEGGEYEALFASVIHDHDYQRMRLAMEEMTRDVGVTGVSIFFVDKERGRRVYVMSTIGDEEHQSLYSPPGYWLEAFDFELEYESQERPPHQGLFISFDNEVNGMMEQSLGSIIPIHFSQDIGTNAFVLVTRPWTEIEDARMNFLRWYLITMGGIMVFLTILSEIVLQFAIVRPLNRMTEEQTRMATELGVAANIQQSMLPDLSAAAHSPAYSVHALLSPAKEVGGDLYDFFVIDEDHVGIVIADVVGKGVPASLFSMVVKTMVKMSAFGGISPREVFEQVNGMLCENNSEAMFATAWLGIYTISEHRLCYANAGHDDPVLYRMTQGAAAASVNAAESKEDEAKASANAAESETVSWKMLADNHDLPLAIMDGMPYEEHTLILEPGERILLYTDGVPEAQVPLADGQSASDDPELYTEDRFLSFLNRHTELSGDELLRAVCADVDAFTGGAPRFDDITMVIFEVK